MADLSSWLPGLFPQGGSSSTGKLYTISNASPACVAGDAVCAVPSDTSGNTITFATPAAAAAAGGVLGLLPKAASAGDTGVAVADGGTLGNASTLLGTGAAGAVVLGGSGRPVRAPRPHGGEFRIGTVDTAGNVTIATAASRATSPVHVYNIAAYGAVPDCETTYGMLIGSVGTLPATDCLPAFNAAKAAIVANGGSGKIRIPAAPVGQGWFFSDVLLIDTVFPIELEGEAAFGVTGLPASVCIFAAGTGGVAIGGAASGSIVSQLTCCHPQLNAPRTWPALAAVSINMCVSPAEGTSEVYYQGIATGGPYPSTGSTQPVFPLCWESAIAFPVGGEIYVTTVAESSGTAYAAGTHSINELPTTYGAPWKYRCTVEGVTAEGRFAHPYSGPAPKWTTGVSPIAGTIVRPTDGAWTGACFRVTTPGTAGAEPNWATATGAGQTVTSGGVTYTWFATCWPRTAGLTTVDGTVSWVLDDTSGQFVDGAVTWNVKPIAACIAFRMSAQAHWEHLYVVNWVGDGYVIDGSHDLGTQANCWSAYRPHCTNVMGDGWRVAGNDCGAGHGDMLVMSNARGACIREDNDIGNTYTSCLIEDGGSNQKPKWAYYSINGTATSSFLGCYTEGALVSRIGGTTTLIAKQGRWSFTPDSGPLDVLNATKVAAYAVLSEKQGLTWTANTYAVPGVTVYPSTPNNKRYVILSTSGSVYMSNAGGEPNFAAHVVNGATFTETSNDARSAGGTITYQVVSADQTTLKLGSQSNPDFILEWSASDDPNKPYTLTNNGRAGWYALLFQNSGGSAAIQFSRSDYAGNGNGDTGGGGWAAFYYGFRWGLSSQLQFVPSSGATYPWTLIQGEGVKGDVAINVYAAQVGDVHASHYYGTSAGTDGAATNYGVVSIKDPRNTAALLVETAPKARWDSGVSGDGTALPAVESNRDAKTTTDATANVVVHTYTPPNGVNITTWFVTAHQTVGSGNPTWGTWKITAAYSIVSGTPTVLDAVVVTAGSANTVSGVTAPAINVNGSALEVRVTGVASKTYLWKTVRESVEG